MSVLRKVACKMGRHSWAWSLPGSRCEIVRKCEFCGELEEEARHIWGPFDDAKDDQCNQIRRCQRCGSTESRPSHEWGPWFYGDEELATAQFHVCRRCHRTERTRRFSTL